MSQNYRVDKETGAVIFKKSAERKQAQQTYALVQQLLVRVEDLEKDNQKLKKMLKKERWKHK